MQVMGQTRSRIKRGIVVGLIVGTVACFFNWLLDGEASPFYRYFLFHVNLPNFWGRLNFIPYVVVLIVGAQAFDEVIYYAAIFTQWAIIALVISLFLPVRTKVRSQSAN